MCGRVLLFSFQGFSTNRTRGLRGCWEASRVNLVKCGGSGWWVYRLFSTVAPEAHIHHICSVCCSALNSGFIWQTQEGFTFPGWEHRGPLVDVLPSCSPHGDSFWYLLVCWRSFRRAQAGPLPPLPPLRSRGQSCSLRPPLLVHWSVSFYLPSHHKTAARP